jgi:hypothetical protein
MPNYGYHLARAESRFLHSAYSRLLSLIVRRPVPVSREIPLDVFSYSSENRLAEQVASIRSFLRYAGRPHRFVVVSDSSHSAKSIELLRQIDASVSVEQVPPPRSDAPASFASYLRNHPTGKQLALVMSLPRERPAVYVDSDVLFFPAAPELVNCVEKQGVPAYYLPDCGFAGDERLLRGSDERSAPVNTGVLLMLRSLDWSVSIDRFLELQGEPNFFTNQTLTHLAMHQNGAQPLDPATCILRLDDQFVHSDRYAGSNLVLRHYVDPVRHKFWTSLAR